ncbi:MAG: lipoate--protein ligase family protein [Elainella sp. Prado103]|jgi:lipoate-protein ligase A|nr:lipoate--protein ligase family protein [Elainella sp. Prado103]
MIPVWRLIPCLTASGAEQMAIDTWLLEQHRLGLHPPTLRFYQWQPIAISLGYHQKQYPPAWRQLRWQGQPIDLVRRPSGGRAVLHQGDLTYAVIGSGWIGTRHQVYEQICQFLIAGWRSLGVELHFGAAGRGYIHNPNCFGTATAADLVTAKGMKFIGSAQLRRGPAILQHGSMRLNADLALFQQVFGAADAAVGDLAGTIEPSPDRLPDRLPDLLPDLPMPDLPMPDLPMPDLPMPDLPMPDLPTIIQSLTTAAIEQFGIQVVSQPLTEQERRSAVLMFDQA